MSHWSVSTMRWPRRARSLAASAVLVLATACVTSHPHPGAPPAPRPEPPVPAPVNPAPSPRRTPAPVPIAPNGRLIIDHPVRIALATDIRAVTLSATGDWRLFDSGGASTVLHADSASRWRIERSGARLRAVSADGEATALRPAPFIAVPAAPGSILMVGVHRYRGEVFVLPHANGVMVVNRLAMEDYLRGVVPLEIGHRTTAEAAAVAAQAVAARSYGYTHLTDSSRPYDMVATVMDQVYGGADAETPLSDAAVRATAGEVLTYGGRVVNAPYHSTCGGETAAASEVWPGTHDEPYLVPVSDRVPGTDRYYCDIAPRFRWTRTFTRPALEAALARYLHHYATVPRGGVGVPRSVEVESRTPSGRVRTLAIVTSRGRYTLRENDIRFVLRSPGGEILNSTAFSAVDERGARGALVRLVLRGRGYGHGIGMCQWGAIGRARAGQDYRTILSTYYPGTTLASVDLE